MTDENQSVEVEDDKSEFEHEDDATSGNDDHSAEAVLARESAKEDRAEYVHPEGARDYRVEGNDVRDYVGVDPEYMTYANPTEAPLLTDTERFLQTSQYDHLEGNLAADGEEENVGQFDGESEETREEKVARYDALVASGMSAHEASEEVWPGEEVKPVDSEPGSAGSETESERKDDGFNPLA